ncbi:aminotransferase class IV [Hymenobacter sp. 15J16-1T3B]|uniref:aminotransferase class IV n=1 Tax=Hymenobacter sp. 15J16-1T3B TaxID=2886941 RepID=UPI001D115807|nr:aminotransferase class IV [Hymenobacter sp. 15J16-1T3B]MCC3158974.1 aminotransferase class IV [Hymenobacter sp. 15J16-1T3B]
MSLVLLDGALLPAADLALPLPNRGLQFNDGFFETLVLVAGRLRYAADHAARMRWAATALHLALPAALNTPSGLERTLQQLAEANGLTAACRLRLQFWRAGGGLYAPATGAVHWLLTAAPFEPGPATAARAAFATSLRTHFSPVSFCKGPYSLHYVLAAQERAARGFDELLLLDAQGHVAEAVAAAVFWLQDGVLFTPALESGCVAGVRRAHLLRVAQQRSVPCQVGLFPAEALLRAEAVFTANVAGIRPLASLEATPLTTEHPLLEALRRWEAA